MSDPEKPRTPDEVVAAVKVANVLNLGRGPQKNTHSGALKFAFREGFETFSELLRRLADQMDDASVDGLQEAAEALRDSW